MKVPTPPTPQRLLPTLTLAVLGLASAGCYTPSIDAMPRVGYFDLDGDFASTAGAPTGPNDLEVLGLDDDKVVFMPRVDWRSGKWDWTIDWIDRRDEGVGVVQNEFTIDGITFGTGSNVNTIGDVSLLRAVATYDLAPSENFVLAPGFGGSIFRYDATIISLDTDADSLSDEDGFMPYLAARAEWTIDSFEVGLLVAWLDFELNDVDATYLDGDAHVRWNFRGRDEGWTGGVVAGYRWLEIDAAYNEQSFGEDIDWETRIQGPYAGLTFGF